MVTDKAHCSEAYCDLHDYLINLPGICLRQDALRRSKGLDSIKRLTDGEAFGEAFQRLADVLERFADQSDHPAGKDPAQRDRHQQPVKSRGRRGGTPE